MRPERLELEGFTSFRDPTTLDFGDADLFALTGPTGAGKSSLIDAMTFALYGTVARYDDHRLVAPVISRGAVEARVSFTFSVDGARHTAARVVRATKSGATTREARLEREDGEVLAGDAKAVTAAVEALLGLSFDHFVTCVVLPQGQFARFLQAERRTRQDLLVELLDLGVYEQMAQQARQRATASAARVETLDGQLGELGEIGPDVVDGLERRLGRLDRLVERIAEAEPRLQDLADEGRALAATTAEAERLDGVLGGLVVPEDIAELAGRLARADEELGELQTEAAASSRLLTDLAARSEDPEGRDRLAGWADLHRRRAKAADRAEAGVEVVTGSEAAMASARTDLEAVDRAFTAAESTLQEAQRLERVEDLLDGLAVGAPCPVCRQVVHEVPAHDPSATLASARAQRDDRAAELKRANQGLLDVNGEHQRATALLARLQDEIRELDAELGDAPGVESVEMRLEQVDLLRADLETARRSERDAASALTAGEARRGDIAAREVALRAGYDEKRDRVVSLGPPAAEHGELAQDWARLADWAVAERDRQREAAATARAELSNVTEQRAAIEGRIAETCAEMGIDGVGADPPRVAVALARQDTEASLATARTHVERRQVLDAERERANGERQVADDLARHLSASGFETWILDEAVDRLVDGASEVLRSLTGGAYSLAMDEKRSGFDVVDHSSADALRPARTLSGGETFLASLALALALADQVAELAADAAPRLEAIFLDEGFGSLDLDTLDVVATALEELGATGRTVGVVTHVRELAERLPVRFEVHKGPHSATIERVER